MKLAAYCRVSTDHEDQLDSLENQKLFFEEYSKRHGYELTNIYADEGISGKQLKKRTQFNKMMQDARFKLFDVVVVKDVARFARNTVDLLTSIRELKALDINTQFITNNMTSLGDSEFVLTIFGALAQEESANTSKRVKFGKKINAEKGRVPNIVYGYRKIDTYNLEIIEEEAIVVRRIFDMFLNKCGMTRIAKTLNSEKIPTKKGSLWEERNIRRLISNPIYKGLMVNHKTEVKDFLTGKISDVPEDEQFKHERPEYAIVSPEIFDAVQAEKERRKARLEHDVVNYNPHKFSSKVLFSNLLYCKECGTAFCRKKQKRKHDTRFYYVCWRKDAGKYAPKGNLKWKMCDNKYTIDESALLDFVFDYFKIIVSDKDEFLQRIIDGTSKDFDKNDFDVKSRQKVLQKQIAKLESNKEKYMTLYTNDIITIEEVKQKTQEIKAEVDMLILELNQMQSKIFKIEDLEERIKLLLLNMEKVLKSKKIVTNTMLREIIKRIDVSKNRYVEIFLNIEPNVSYKGTPNDIRKHKILTE